MSERYKITDQQGIYFVTCTVIGWVDIFTRPVYKNTILDSLTFCRANKGLNLHGFVLMTNHLHMIISSKQNAQLSFVLRDFKKFTSGNIKKILQTDDLNESRKEWLLNMFTFAGVHNSANKDFQLWKNDNHPIYLYSSDVIKQKLDYIHQNPVRAGFVDKPEHWLYSSASNYCDTESLIDIDYLY